MFYLNLFCLNLFFLSNSYANPNSSLEPLNLNTITSTPQSLPQVTPSKTTLSQAQLPTQPSPTEIMAITHDLDTGDNVIQDLAMILVGRGGEKRPRQLRSFRKKSGDNLNDLQMIMFFTSPSKYKNIGLLAYDYHDNNKKDKQWIYLPEIKKTKLIASAGKNQPFMSSDFSYADLALRNTNNYHYRLLSEEELYGETVWVIESIPNNQEEITETGYVKSISFVRQDNFVVIRTINHLKKGKRIKTMDVLELENINGIWTPLLIEMKTEKTGIFLSKTIMKTLDIKFNQKLPDYVFLKNSLARGL